MPAYTSPLPFHSHRRLSVAKATQLVVGGVDLALEFKQCMISIKQVDVGTKSTPSSREAAYMLTLIGSRVNRWERAIRESTDLQLTLVDGENARRKLQRIQMRLEDAEESGERYTVNQSGIKSIGDSSRMLERLQSKILPCDDGSSLAQGDRWALVRQEEADTLVDSLNRLVTGLEQMAPSLGDRLAQMAKNDIVGLLTGEQSEDLQALKAAAARVDKDFENAASSESHTYKNIKIQGEALVNTGDHYDSTWRGPMGGGGRNTYTDVTIEGKPRVILGNKFGGKSVFKM